MATGSGPAHVAERQGGAAVGQLGISITLQGHQRTLTVESIDIVPKAPKATRPFDGALLCSEGQGDSPKVKLAADTDDPDPYLYDEDSPYRSHFHDNVITLAPQEQVSIRAFFQSKQGHREFELVMRYTLNGKRYSQKIPPPSGKAYAVTALNDTYDIGYLYAPTGPHRMTAREMCGFSAAKKCR